VKLRFGLVLHEVVLIATLCPNLLVPGNSVDGATIPAKEAHAGAGFDYLRCEVDAIPPDGFKGNCRLHDLLQPVAATKDKLAPIIELNQRASILVNE